MRPLVLTPGEPAGIGPDLCLQLASRPHPCPMLVIADPDMLAARAGQLGLVIRLHEYTPGTEPVTGPGHLSLLPVTAPAEVVPGRLDPGNAKYVLETIRLATEGCLAGDYHALVTGPIHKGVINDAGIRFSGHTEFLAGLCKVRQVVMMLAIPNLRVALATTHLPLREVSDAISSQGLETTLRILHDSLSSRFDCNQPRILVCGLNPHAGEDGHLGREEIDIIIPLLDRLRREGMQLEGPVPADTAFVPERLAQTDAVLAMYHDQGLPVLKSLGFGEAVNITLGLPIIRTSVDHGTALSLAGTGKASCTSLESAILMAMGMQA